MTLQTSGPISIGDVMNEFGRKTPSGVVPLSDYYAGRGVVRAGTLGYPNGVATPIPSSGSIALSNFYGAKKKAIVENYASYFATCNINLDLAGGNDTNLMYITTTPQPVMIRQNGTTKNTTATRRIAFRTKSLIQDEYDSLNMYVGRYGLDIRNLFSYSDLNPVSEGDVIYFTHGMQSDEYGYSGFQIFDLETGSSSYVNIIGGDMNSRDNQYKSWIYTSAGIRVINNKLDTSLFTGKKLIFPYWRVLQNGGYYNHKNQEFNVVHLRGPFGGSDINGITGLYFRGSSFQQLLVPNTSGLPSPYPDIFDINGYVMNLKQDILVITHTVSSTNNTYGFPPQNIPGLLLHPSNVSVYRPYTSERYSEYIPYIFNAGTYQLSNTSAIYDPTIFVI